MTMIRPSSPAMSEISVGSPSPPPTHRPSLLIASRAPLQNGFHIMPGMKRPKTQMEAPQNRDFCLPLTQRRKSSNERVKSFSIADILGKTEDATESRNTQTTPPPSAIPAGLAVPSILSNIPGTHAMPASVVGPTAASLLMLELPSIHKVIPPSWGDPSRLATVSSSPSTSLPIHPFFPPALLHYEQRLAWDYQRQLQEHFHAQAQLMRQMSMDPNIILSEDGSERGGSRDSSSGGSQCCSPEVNVASSDEGGDDDVDRNDSTRLSHERLSNAETEGSTKSAFEKTIKTPNDTPLDALFQLSTKNFDEDQDPATLSIFATRPNPKKKRKSRTAFTNHQIFELEKRFLYQKYLSPADRDEIAAGLGLSNAQVITWFQNRRAKLKRDMEELKKDVESVKQLSAHKSFLENVNDLSILKTRPVSRDHQQPCQPQQPTEVIHSAAPTHGSLGTSTGAAPTASATPPAAAGLSPSVRHRPTTIQHHPPHQHQPHISTTSTCNEIRQTEHCSNISTSPTSNSASHSDSGQPPVNRLMPQHHRRHHHHHHQPRNIQINSSRG